MDELILPLAPSNGPEGVALAFGQALSACDAAGATACFAPDGCLITPDGTEVAGRQGIHDVLVQLTAIRPTIRFEAARTVRVGTVALHSQHWSVRTDGAAPEPLSQAQAFLCTLVLRCEERQWHLAVAAPWGKG